ncbi:MAG TPA: SDR family NAD(P)-dependent oxidoreductase [Steroidobacteraceae bacterium]|nr:SDR family NAD(P)-dependent oxidoreductase [Steroidobacteraceae bacterium]
MEDVRNKIAFITGAASGIGLGLARTFAAARMTVVMADVRVPALEAAAASLGATGAKILALPLDVTDRAAWSAAVDRVERELGPVELLCSNAGVNFIGATQEATYQDWDFGLGVNLGGAINAVHTIVPRMIASGRGGHVVITSSVSGLFTGGGSGVYATTKYALVGLAESLRGDLKRHGIGVSVLCPGPVKSELFESTAAVRPAKLAATGSIPVVPPGVSREDTPIFVTAPSGEEVGQQVLAGIRRNDLYILTHSEIRPVLEARAAALIAALPAEPVNEARIAASRGLLDTSLYASAKS